jgi:uncharacterized OB-fold protein
MYGCHVLQGSYSNKKMKFNPIYITCVACGYDGLPKWRNVKHYGELYATSVCPACNSSQVKERDNPI